MATKRQTAAGNWEYIIKRKALLGKPVSLRFDTEAEGDAYCARLEAMLDRGEVPPELLRKEEEFKTIGDIIKAYLLNVAVSKADKPLLNALYAKVGSVDTKKVSYEWVEKWIRDDMKATQHLNPSTIRHYVGALGRCFDWAGRKGIAALVSNPLRQLPKNYAQYTDRDTDLARTVDPKFDGKVDEERDRRLEHGEEERIRDILDKQKPKARQRPMDLNYQGALELLFDLALETAMRMREIYTLTLDQVDMDKRTIFLDKTKNGDKRQVPMSSVAIAKLNLYLHQVANGARGMEDYAYPGGRLFPWWDGNLEEENLKKITMRLSSQFARIFAAAGCSDLRFHDLRHEATSRFFERTKMQDFEIMKITGHSSTRMLRRYSNIRGSTLADKLW